MRSRTPPDEPGIDPAAYYAAAVYGSIISAALIVPFFEQHGSAETVALTLLSTMAVFFLAHVWSTIIGERIHTGSAYNTRHTLAVARSEWPLLESTFVPVLVLLLGWAGVWSDSTAERIALVVCLVELFVWGVVVGRKAYPGRASAILSGLVNVALGVGLIWLEVIVLH